MPGESAIIKPIGARRFDVLRVLGTGGMGVVYEALDRDKRRKVALKTLRSLDASAVLRFKEEFRSLQDIEHPNLVSLGELFEEDGQLFFTMELVQGTPFVEYVRPDTTFAGANGRPSASAFSGDDSSSEGTLGSGGRRSAERIADGAARQASPRDQASMRSPLVRASGAPPAPLSGSDRPPTGAKCFDERRLRDAFGQLSRGLHALHGARKVHRDIKPSNVLVTAAGRVVILDFGLVMSVSPGKRDTAIVGTAHYMAPEQAAGRTVGPEADWYSMGVMLYLALTGVFPFRVSSDQVLELKQEAPPPPPGAWVPDLPRDLEELCVGLLRRSASARPKGRDVLRVLGALEDIEGAPLSSRPHGFVGRRRELTALRDAFAEACRGAPLAVLIEGESGMGKSALMRRFVEQLDGSAVILAGRCHEREWVPYKAVDELIDALSRHLAGCWASDVEELLPSHAALLADVFPVLRMIPALRRRREPDAETIEPLDLRALVFATLRELLGRLAREKPLVLAIDDLQWADVDSLALLAEVMRPPRSAPAPLSTRAPRSVASPASTSAIAPPILLVATVRTGAEASPRAAPWLALPPGAIRTLPLCRLPADEAQELVAALLREAGDPHVDRAAPDVEDGAPVSRVAINAEALVEEAGGLPLFIDALLRYRLVEANDGGPVRLDEALWAQIQRLDARAQALVELIAVAGGPLLLEVAERALSAEADELTRLTAVLRGAKLARKSGTGRDERIEPYHDRIREIVASRLEPDVKRAWHERLACALEAQGGAELEALAVHFQEAGNAARAAEYAARAGDKAALALAFDRAARLYGMALELRPCAPEEQRELLIRWGDALSNAGRSAEAAVAYLSGSQAAPAALALELTRRAADNYLRSGYVDEGMACLRKVLAEVDLEAPKTPAEALLSLLIRRAVLHLRGLSFDERQAPQIPPDTLARIDVCWSAAIGLSMVDPIAGSSYQTLHLLLSLDAGEPYRIARSLAAEAAFVASLGGSERARFEELMAAARKVAERTSHPHAIGLVELSTGVAWHCVGRFRESLMVLDSAETIFRERCTGVAWERSSLVTFAAWNLWLLGDLPEFTRHVPIHLHEAQERGDRYLATNLRTCFANAYWLIQDNPEAARAAADAGIERWSTQGFQLPHFFDFIARGQIFLYEGEREAGHRYVESAWARLSASLTLRMQVARISSLHLLGRTALAAAQGASDPAPFLEQAKEAADKLSAEQIPWAEPLAAMLRAGGSVIEGDRPRAASLLACAASGFEAADMALYLAAARRRLGELLGGDEGLAQAEEAKAWMAERGVVNPDRMTEMLAPGF
jgi:serine/threonine protein kinase